MWLHHFGVSGADAGAEIYDAWDKVRAPVGFKVLQDVVRKAKENLLPLATRCTLPGYNLFLNVVCRLQRLHGESNVPISTRTFAEAMGVTHDTIGRYCNTGKKEGMLIRARAHVFRGGGGRNRAAEYRFDLSRVPPDCRE